MKVLCINPGSTSTKIGAYSEHAVIGTASLRHDAAVLEQFERATGQLPYRLAQIRRFLDEHDIAPDDFDAFIGRGGLLHPLVSGTYRVNDDMCRDLEQAAYGEHASNLGALLARELGRLSGKPAYIADPVVVDEFDEVARFSGMPEIKRRSIFHALNQKAVGRRHAAWLGRTYKDLNLIICHMGGGITVGAHGMGRCIDVNNALDGDGPFSPERAGGMPTGQLADLCFSCVYTLPEMKRKITGGGGLVAYLGTSDAQQVEARIAAGDDYARLVYDAMIYQICKEIGAAAVVLQGRADAILLTGGLAHSDYVTDRITARVAFLAPVHVYPGENELQALAEAGFRVLRGEEEARIYQSRPASSDS